MIWTNILQVQKYGVVQTVSRISRDFLFLAIKLNCSDRFFFQKGTYERQRLYLKMCKVLKTFPEGNARKSTVNFAFSGYADVIKYQEKPTFSYERAQITEARIISVRGHKTIGSHLKVKEKYFVIATPYNTSREFRFMFSRCLHGTGPVPNRTGQDWLLFTRERSGTCLEQIQTDPIQN